MHNQHRASARLYTHTSTARAFLILPHVTGHRVKAHTMIHNEVLNESKRPPTPS